MSNNNENKNLQNIQRIDTNACEIILQCTQAAYYEFDLMENNWKTKDQVGPLFVYKRLDYPHYAIMIANRQSLEDFVQPIEETSSLRYDPPYILIHRKDGTIGGIWIYGEDECKRIFASIQKLRDIVVKEEACFISNMKAESAKSPVKTNEASNVKKPDEVIKVAVKTPEKIIEKTTPKKPPEVKTGVKAEVKKTEANANIKISPSGTDGRLNFKPLRTLDPSKLMKKNVKNINTKPPASVELPKQHQQPPPTPKIMSRAQSINNFVREVDLPKTSDIAAAAASVLPEIIQENGRGGDIGILKMILLEFIKRIDPFACRLLNYLPRAALYEYDSLEKKWKRTETEGPFVVFSRIDEPFYSLLVVDRKQRGKEDFLQPLVPGIKLTNKSPYIFISGRQDNMVFGLWLQDQDDCTRVYHDLSALLSEVNKLNEEHMPSTIDMF
uniref:Uncharacterized protein n=2 Tax=Meloidogyne TaxID=189290 RepID=A0A914M3X5_MELIC